MDYRFIVYIIFGVLPSLVWLGYYLLKDSHPEPKKTLLRIFLWGGVMTIPVLFLQLALTQVLDQFEIGGFTRIIIHGFLVIALVEEFFKFAVVKLKVLNSPDLDEPLDVMLYMIVSALGFAAFENMLYLFGARNSLLSFDQLIQGAIFLSFIRFIGATFVHTLCSGVVGYFLALEVASPRRKFFYAECGLITATMLHGIYNLAIMNLKNYDALIMLFIILLTFGFLTLVAFNNLSKMKSVTKI